MAMSWAVKIFLRIDGDSDMGVRLEHDKVTSVPVQAMHDGEIAIAESWESKPSRVGYIYQRFGDTLVGVGRHSGAAIGNVWGSTALGEPVKGLRVRVLKAGEKIVIN